MPTLKLFLLSFAELSDELGKRRNAFFPVFKRSERTIQLDITAAQARRSKLLSEVEDVKIQYAKAKATCEAAKSERDQLHGQLGKVDRSLVERIIATAEKNRAPFVAELREIESTIAELRLSIMKEAKVFGATCTKAYLAVKEIGQVDMVIFDEASMVLLPMIWFVSGLAKDRVVVSGDFRQIPPIVQTSQKPVYDVLGHDVFTAAGLDNPHADDARMVMLDTQYRMDKVICELISEPMYSGRLRTAVDSERTLENPPSPYDGTLTIVDTSDLWPFESVNAFFSRFNLMHALLARNLAWHFNRQVTSEPTPIWQFVPHTLPNPSSSGSFLTARASERLSKLEPSTVFKVMSVTPSFLNCRKAMAEPECLDSFFRVFLRSRLGHV